MKTFFPKRPQQSLVHAWQYALASPTAQPPPWPGLLDTDTKPACTPGAGNLYAQTCFSPNGAVLGAAHLCLRIAVDAVPVGTRCTVWVDETEIGTAPIGTSPLRLPLQPLADRLRELTPLCLTLCFADLVLPDGTPPTIEATLEGQGRPCIGRFSLRPARTEEGQTAICCLETGGSWSSLAYRWLNGSGDERAGQILTRGAFELPMPPVTWSPAEPHLHHGELALLNAAGEERDCIRMQTAASALRWKEARLYQDEYPIALRLAALRGPLAPVSRDEVLDSLATAGCTGLWIELDSGAEAWARACDERGLLVVFGLSGHAAELWQEAVSPLLHHPAIVAWAVQIDPGQSARDNALRAQALQGLDPGRSVLAFDSPRAGCHAFHLRGPGAPGGVWVDWLRLPPEGVRGLRPPTSDACSGQEGASPFRWWNLTAPGATPPDAGGEPAGTPPAWEAGCNALGVGPRAADLAQRAERRAELRMAEFCDALGRLRVQSEAALVIDCSAANFRTLEDVLPLQRCPAPVFTRAPTTVLREEGYEVGLAVTGDTESEVRISLFEPERHLPIWRTTCPVHGPGGVPCTVRVPQRLLLPGRHILEAEVVGTQGGARSGRPLTVLDAVAGTQACAEVLCPDPALAAAFGLSSTSKAGGPWVVLTLGNSLLEHGPAALAAAFAAAEAGQTVLLLGVPGDTGDCLCRLGHLEKPFTLVSLGPDPKGVTHLAANGELFEDLPPYSESSLEWGGLLPANVVCKLGGTPLAAAFADHLPQGWGSSVHVLALGAGRVVLTTLQWKACLGRDALADALLQRLVRSFSSPGGDAVPGPRTTDLVSHFTALCDVTDTWHGIGPFLQPRGRGGIAAALGKALSTPLELEERPLDSGQYTDRRGRQLRWRSFLTPQGGRSTICLGRTSPTDPTALFVLGADLPREQAGSQKLALRTPHPLALRLNGRILWLSLEGCDSEFSLPLCAGENRVTLYLAACHFGPPGSPEGGLVQAEVGLLS